MICFEPQKALGTASNKNKIQKVMFISEDNIKLYYIKGDGYDNIEAEIPDDQKTYFKNILCDAYYAQTRGDFSVELRHHICSGTFSKQLKGCDSSLQEEWEIYSDVTDDKCYWNKKNSSGYRRNHPTHGSAQYRKYNYYGVFVYLGTGAYGSQGRIVYTVIRELKKPTDKPTVNVPFEKDDNNGNVITTSKGKFKITFDTNKVKLLNSTAGSITKQSNKFTLNFKPVSNNGSFDLKVKEVSAPEGFQKVTDEATITIHYNTTNGNITGIDVHDNAVFTNSGKSVGIKMKNDPIPNEPLFYLKKIDNEGNPIANVTFSGTIKIGYINYDLKPVTTDKKGMTENILTSSVQNAIKTKGAGKSYEITLKEIDTPEKYRATTETISFSIYWDETKAIGKSPTGCEIDSNTSIVRIKNTKIEPIWFTIKKVDDENKGFENLYDEEGILKKNEYSVLEEKYLAKFEIEAKQNGKIIYKASSEDDSKDDLFALPRYMESSEGFVAYQTSSSIYPPTNDTITMTITEVHTPEGFEGAKKVVIEFKYNSSSKIWEPEVKEGEEELVEFSQAERNWYGEAKNRYYPNYKNHGKYLIRTDRVAVEENGETIIKRDFNRSFGIKIKNSRKIIRNVKLYKYDKTGNNAVNGATFNMHFENIEYIKIGEDKKDANSHGTCDIEGISDVNGLIAEINEIKSKNNSDTVYMTITEIETVSGFDKLSAPAKLMFKYDTSAKKWVLSIINGNELDGHYDIVNGEKGDKFTLKLKDDYKLDKLTILKTDSLDNNKVEGAKFDVTLENVKSVKGYSAGSSDTLTITGVTTDEKGNIVLEDVVIKDISQPVKITIVETEAPEGYKKIDGEMYVYITKTDLKNNKYLIKRDKQTSVLEDEFKAGEETVEGNTISLGINDIPALQELDLIKKDSQDVNKDLLDAEFELTFNNVEYYYINGTKYTDATKEGVKISDGIEKILPADINQPMIITLEETKAPRGYKRIEGTITLNIKYEDNEQRYSIEATSTGKISKDKEFNTSDVGNTDKKNVYVTMKDIPLINIGGIVWEDAQSGIKNIAGPDGVLNYGDEKGIPEIGIKIYDKEGNPVTEDAYGTQLMKSSANVGDTIYPAVDTDNVTGNKHHTYTLSGDSNNTVNYELCNGGSENITLSNGEYIFPNLEKGVYYVEFYYDGINYKTTTYHGDDVYKPTTKTSKVEEEGRSNFDSKFKIISENKANGTAGDITLSYIYNSDEKTSQLDVGIQGKNPANNSTDFQMKAKSKNYLKPNDSDWAAVWNSDGTINRNHYALDVNCGLTEKYFDLALGTDVKSAKVKINGKEATYNYAQIMNGELEDLDLDKITQNKSSEVSEIPGIPYTLYLYKSDYNFRIEDYRTDMSDKIENKVNEEDNNETAYDVKKELEVYVTYSIVLKNQSAQTGTVEKFVYYYDEKYKDPVINAGDGYTADIDDTNKVITFECTGDCELKEREDNNECYRKEIEVTFTVDKNNDRSLKLGEFSNVGEITVYSTPNGGFIDYDSAPDNAEINMKAEKKIGQYEDDCDEAQGLNILINEKEVREATGIVFEDDNKNGKNDDGIPVNNVIVQLIELKTISDKSDKYYEYIWQQTRSGSNEVLTTTRNGYDEDSKYYSGATGDGVYQFKDFIPGNYIIRFIYGDGTTYDMNLDGVRKYNGQDYQSTIDKNYKEKDYKSENYSPDSSVAVDNEARRLEVMSYSSSIDGGNGTAIEAFIRNLNFDTLTNEQKQNLNNYFNELKDEYNSTPGSSPTARIKQIFNDDDMAKGEVDQDIFNKIQRYASWKTWMCAESSNVEVGVKENTSFANMNFGLALRPKTKLSLEKHITALKIKPQGNVQPIVEATIDINDIVKGRDITVSGKKEGLAIIPSTRNERGFWKVETDIEELAQGANVELEYTYVIKNESEPDYLGREIIGNYLTKAGNYSDGDKIDDYATYLSDISESVKKDIKGRRDYYGAYLGYYYYTGDDSKVGPVDSESIDSAVPARVTTIKDYLNNNLKLVSSVERLDFEKSNNEAVPKIVYGVDRYPKTEDIETVISNIERFNELLPANAEGNDGENQIDTIDTSKKVEVQTILSASNKEISYSTYIGEITKYTSATGRKDMESTPENLSYVNSEDTSLTLSTPNNDGRFWNEFDEFWGEKLIVSKPTGENKQAPVQIIVIAISSVAVIGVGIILIKKFVLKK